MLNIWFWILCGIRKNRMFVLKLIVLGFSWETIRRQHLQKVQNLYQTNMMSLQRNIYTKGNGWWQMKYLSINGNHEYCWILQSLIFAQCHKKEHSYVNNEAEPSLIWSTMAEYLVRFDYPVIFLKVFFSDSKHVKFLI